jgi:hypothetical protein
LLAGGGNLLGYLGSFNTNYVSFKNIEMILNKKISKKYKEIFYNISRLCV